MGNRDFIPRGLGASTIVALCVLMGLWAFSRRTFEKAVSVLPDTGVQCGHWAVYRMARAQGLPTSMLSVSNLLPSRQKGHSLQELAEALGVLGLRARGESHTLESLKNCDLPVIVHLVTPAPHFVVINSITNDTISIFDSGGQLRFVSIEEITSRWSGKVLLVKPKTLDMTHSKKESPRIELQTLIIDRGAFAVKGELMWCNYPFVNSGTLPLVLEKIELNGKAEEIDYPKSPVPPGHSGEIKIGYRIDPREGTFVKRAIVHTNDPEHPHILLEAIGKSRTDVSVSIHRLLIAGNSHTASAECFISSEQLNSSALKGYCDIPSVKIELIPVGRKYFADRYSNSFNLTSSPPGIVALRATYTLPVLKAIREKGRIFVQTNVKDFETITIPIEIDLRP